MTHGLLLESKVMRMKLSAFLTSLPMSFESAVQLTAALGFTQVDVVALAERPESHSEALAESGLLVSCAAIGRGLPAGHTLSARPIEDRRSALETMKRQIADAARLGAGYGYVVPGMDSGAEDLAVLSDACALLADFAAQRMVKLCVEHVPGRALPSVATTLAWLERVNHPNLYLLLDVGHCLISGEDPAQAVDQAGKRLGYVHLDDNDGRGDLHWPLLTGKLTGEQLKAGLTALVRNQYAGSLALELNPNNPDPVDALRQGKTLLEGLMSGMK
jgi:sugar phosphate isomerase/epimerase